MTDIYFEIYQDATFEFERKRNRPERYDRNLTEQTLKAIPLIIKTRHDRLEKHISNRSVLLLQFCCLFDFARIFLSSNMEYMF